MSLASDDKGSKGKKRESITIKGTGGGLLIRLRDDAEALTTQELLAELETRLQQGTNFFRNARSSIDLGRRELETADLEALQELLVRYEINLESIVSGSNATRSAAKQVGLPIRLPSLATTRAPSATEVEGGAGLPFDSAEALFVRRTLRSGQLINHHADVCLVGDVNPGAEIIAGGSIIIWGMLRGTVQAGALPENAKIATVCALYFSPAQVRIGDLISRGPELGGQPELRPEIALVRDNRIVVEPWSRRKY